MKTFQSRLCHRVANVYTQIDEQAHLAHERRMHLTRAFRSGNSQAVRIPAELAYEDIGAALKITRLGDVITIVPANRSLKRAVAELRALPKPDAPEIREPIELPDRD